MLNKDPLEDVQSLFCDMVKNEEQEERTSSFKGASCFTVKVKDVTDVDIEADKRRLRERCLPWNYPAVLVANDNTCKTEKSQLSLVGGKGEGISPRCAIWGCKNTSPVDQQPKISGPLGSL